MAISFDLNGKAALVTGANTGIGQAIAVALAEAGADVAVAGRSEPTETLALIGLLATLARVVPALAGGNLARPAVLAQVAMAVLLGVYIALGVKSFKEARRARLAR